jgi:hypothetical protein
MQTMAEIIGALVIVAALIGFIRGLLRSRRDSIGDAGDGLGGGTQGPGHDGGH